MFMSNNTFCGIKITELACQYKKIKKRKTVTFYLYRFKHDKHDKY